jgi:phosphoglucosamine mutase
MARTGRELAELADRLTTFPQVLVNVRVRERADYSSVPGVAAAIRRVEGLLDGQGRLLIRYSGTEPLLRIMIEGRDHSKIQHWADEIASEVRASLG